MNTWKHLKKLESIRDKTALVLALINESVDNGDIIPVEDMITQTKQEIFELLLPADIYVVYKKMKIYQGGIEKDPVGFYANQNDAENDRVYEVDNCENSNIIFVVQKEELR